MVSYPEALFAALGAVAVGVAVVATRRIAATASLAQCRYSVSSCDLHCEDVGRRNSQSRSIDGVD